MVEKEKYLMIKVDVGKTYKQLQKAIREGQEDVIFFAGFNKQKSSADRKPLYNSRDVAVWLNEKEITPSDGVEERVVVE